MDFWGPLTSGEHLLVMIDKYSRYSEVEIVQGTSAEAVVPHIDRVFSTHGFPDTVQTDGGPPFNGTESHLYQQYMRWAGVETKIVTPDHPEANGLAENFMKTIKKLWHTAIVEKKNPKQELYKFLRNYRATPHSSTKRAPAELLFNREIKVRLPQVSKKAFDPELRANDAAAKTKQKKQKDAKILAKPHDIKISDTVLLARQTTKSQSKYDPDPYLVTKVKGSQITATRDGQTRVRNSQRFKKVRIANPKRYERIREPLTQHATSDRNSNFRFSFETDWNSASKRGNTNANRNPSSSNPKMLQPPTSGMQEVPHQQQVQPQVNDSLPNPRSRWERGQALRNLQGAAHMSNS